MLETAVENIGILEKSGVSDYTPFGMSMPERSWSLPDACNTYTSLYYDNVLDIDCWVDCGTWVPYGTSSFTTCHLDQGYLQIGLYGNLTRGAYTEFDTETDSTYVMSMDITGYNTNCTWEVSVRDGQGNTIVAHTVTQTGTLNLEFTAVGSKSRVYVRRLSSTVTFGSFGLRTLSIDGKYHKEDVMYLSYRYGFNSQEKDDEIYGTGNSYTAAYWQYDSRLGRRWNVDPKPNISISPFSSFQLNPIWFTDQIGDTVKVTTSSGIYLFSLDDGRTQVFTVTAKQVYDLGYQWFEPKASKYVPLVHISPTITQRSELKHFKWSDIALFSNREFESYDFFQGRSGDWKQVEDGADGYFLVTVDGYPYWADAVGQIPFAVWSTKNRMQVHGDENKAIEETLIQGRKWGTGTLFGEPQNDNGYDHYFVFRGAKAATEAFDVNSAKQLIFDYNFDPSNSSLNKNVSGTDEQLIKKTAK